MRVHYYMVNLQTSMKRWVVRNPHNYDAERYTEEATGNGSAYRLLENIMDVSHCGRKSLALVEVQPSERTHCARSMGRRSR